MNRQLANIRAKGCVVLVTVVFSLVFPLPVFLQANKKLVPNFPFRIVNEEVRDNRPTFRPPVIYVFLEERHFSSTNLQKLFLYLSTVNSSPSMKVTVFSDQGMLLRFMKAEENGVPYFVDTPDGKKAREKFFDENYPPEMGYFRAFFHKDSLSEYFYYTPRKNVVGLTMVTLRTDDKFANTPEFLFTSIKKGYLNAVIWVLSQGQNLNVLDKEGVSPLSWAVSLHHNEIAVVLIGASADVNMMSSDGSTPLFYAVSSENYDGTKLLIEKGAYIDARDKQGRTPLMEAALNCNASIIKLLLLNHADTTVRDKDGKTALTYACEDKEILKLLKVEAKRQTTHLK